MAHVPVVRIDRSLRRSLRTFDEDRLHFLDEAAALGPVAGLRFGPSTVYVVSDAELARTMLVTDAAAWTRPPAMRLPVRLGVGENIFTESDKAWSRSQPVVAPAFRGRALASRLEGLDAIVDAQLTGTSLGENVDLELLMGQIALVIAAWVFLGEELDAAHAQELADHQRQVVAWVGRRLGALSAGIPIALGADARRMRVHRRALEHYVDGVVDRAVREERVEDTVLGRLCTAEAAGRALDRDGVRGQLLGLLLAGNETTAAALSWVLVHAAQHPDLWDELRRDESRVDAFVAETLRVSPPAWGLTRTPTRGGVSLRRDDGPVRVRRPGVVTVYLRAIHRDASVWPDPLRFDPTRHATDGHGVRTLIPFGLGPRGCIGQHLALAELRAITPALARRGDVEISGPVVEDASFSLRPRGGLRGRFVACPGPRSEA
jgi:cytochrome P450